ncbi:MAG TPA: zinc ribbon domain-containing protein [Candidatus Bathyarchaeia archaeon]|nr:zinc ribbon domain-containing protein [Candidatus Bathyarchaeia archaeon]
MVYCSKCGTKNEDAAAYCVKCGMSLQTGTTESRRYERKRAEGECFGLPHGGAIAGIAIGSLILLWGIFTLAEQQRWISQAPELWWLVIIIIGILIIAGGIYRSTRRY